MEHKLLGDELRRLTKERREAVEKFELLKKETPKLLIKIARESDHFEAIIIKSLTGTHELTIDLFINWLIDQNLICELKEGDEHGCDALHVSWKP